MDSDGMVVCSDVSEDGSKLLVTAAPKGQADIFLYDVKTKQKKQVAGGPAWIDVGGQFVENDQEIVFVSDRLGNPTIFKQRIGSSGVARMVFHSKNNSSVTTNGNNIIYSSKDSENEMGKSFNLYLISTRTDSMQQLTSQGVNQFPKFSPDGQSVLFIKTVGNASAVGIIRLEYNKSFLFPLSGKRIQSIDW
jgi:TolB protein